jgi:hypothetical protein
MRFVQLCERNGPSTNPSGLNELGYAMGNQCTPFGTAAKPARVCRPGILGPGMKPTVCRPDDPPAVDPKSKPKPTTSEPASPTRVPTALPATAAIVGLPLQ